MRVRVRVEYMKGGVSRMKSKLKDNFFTWEYYHFTIKITIIGSPMTRYYRTVCDTNIVVFLDREVVLVFKYPSRYSCRKGLDLLIRSTAL